MDDVFRSVPRIRYLFVGTFQVHTSILSLYFREPYIKLVDKIKCNEKVKLENKLKIRVPLPIKGATTKSLEL